MRLKRYVTLGRSGAEVGAASAQPGQRVSQPSEFEAAQPVEDRRGILLISRRTSIVRAERQAAYVSELVGRHPSESLSVEPLPKLLVEPTAVHPGMLGLARLTQVEVAEPG